LTSRKSWFKVPVCTQFHCKRKRLSNRRGKKCFGGHWRCRPKLYFNPFQEHPTFIRKHPPQRPLIYRQGVHVLCQRRAEPAKRGNTSHLL
jgi:hypothetical protein